MSCRLRRPSKTHHLEKPQNPDHTEFIAIIASVFMEKYRKGKAKTTSTTETAKACS